MKYFKDKILPMLIGALVTGFIALLTSIFSELLPAISPFLRNVPVFLYLKIILLLTVLLLIAFLLVLVFYKKSKEFKPFLIWFVSAWSSQVCPKFPKTHCLVTAFICRHFCCTWYQIGNNGTIISVKRISFVNL